MFAKRTKFTGSFLSSAAELAFAPIRCAAAQDLGAVDDRGHTVQIVGFTPERPTPSGQLRRILAQDVDDVIEAARRANISIQ
jgi:hypothetical protein